MYVKRIPLRRPMLRHLPCFVPRREEPPADPQRRPLDRILHRRAGGEFEPTVGDRTPQIKSLPWPRSSRKTSRPCART